MNVASFAEVKAFVLSQSRNPAKAFLAIALVLGLIFIVLTPPMQAPDEHHHFFRSYQVASGNWIPDVSSNPDDPGVGGLVPESFKIAAYYLLGNLPGHPEHKASPALIQKYLHANVEPQHTNFAHFEPASSSSPLPYLPQAFGMKLAELLGGSVLALFYAARLANFLVWLALAYFAIKLLPTGRWIYCLLLLSPVMVFQAASLSPDATTNGLAFIYVALVLKLATAKSVVRAAPLAGLLVLAASLAACKQAYFIIGFLGLMIPAARFSARKYFWAFVAALVAACLVPSIWWALQAGEFLPYLNKVFQPTKVVSPTGQIQHALHHPLGFAHSVVRTIFSDAGDYLFLEFYGRLGWADVRLPMWLVVSQFVVLALVWLAERPLALGLWQKRFALAIFAAVSAAVVGVVYLSWAEVGDRIVIRGLQGRYFLPVSAMLVLFVPFRRVALHMAPGTLRALAIVSPLTVLILSMASLYVRYY